MAGFSAGAGAQVQGLLGQGQGQGLLGTHTQGHAYGHGHAHAHAHGHAHLSSGAPSLNLNFMPEPPSVAGNRDSIVMVDDVGGEWEREGLGRGLEERLEALQGMGDRVLG